MWNTLFMLCTYTKKSHSSLFLHGSTFDRQAITKFEWLDSYEILKFCDEKSWGCPTSELRFKPKTIEFLSSFIRNMVRKDQLPLLDLRHLHV